MILWGLPVSTYTAKVRIALHAKGMAFEECEPEGGYRSEAWRARVPTGTIPALEVEGVLLAESEAIVEYLEERCPHPSLLPGTPLQRAQARRLARFHDLHLEPTVRALFPLLRDPARATKAVGDAFDEVEARLGVLTRSAHPAPWLAGERLSVADLGMVVIVELTRRLALALGVSLTLPAALQRWLEFACAHPAVQAGMGPWSPAVERWLASSLASHLVPMERR